MTPQQLGYHKQALEVCKHLVREHRLLAAQSIIELLEKNLS